MKSLSPNAQEFVPLSLKNQNMIQQQHMPGYYMDQNSIALYNIGYPNMSFNYQYPTNYQFYPSNQMFIPPLRPSLTSNQLSVTNQPERKSWNKFKKNDKKYAEKPLNINSNEFPALTPNEKPNVISTINMNNFIKAKENAEKKLIAKQHDDNYSKPDNRNVRTFKDAVLTSKDQATTLQELKNDQNPEKSKKKNSKKRKKAKREFNDIPVDESNKSTDLDQNFTLDEIDFPDLCSSSNVNPRKSWVEDKHLSDAYSSDATLDASMKLKTSSQIIEVSKLKKTNAKKIHQPLTIEFANMISALQKDQNMQRNNQVKIQAKTVANILLNRQEKNMTMQLVNPLDTSSIVKRGKEREKPKSKKKSTLKKIILKEREEKRKIRDELEKSDNFDDTSSIPNLSCLFSNSNTESIIDNDVEDDIDTDANKTDFESDTNNDILSPISQPSPVSINEYNPSPYATLDFSNSPISLEKLEEQVKKKIHSRKFREYCNQIISQDIDNICLTLLQEIARFQDRLYHKFPNKAKSKRRFVMGIREVTKHLKLQKIKCVIIAPNCEKIESKGGLDDAINSIIQIAMEQNIPFLFALGRKDLGKAVKKIVPISVIGIFDYSGAEEHFKRLVELANNAKLAYQDMVEDLEKEECENILCQSVKEKVENMSNNLNFMPKIPSHMAHSRTPSNGSNISIEPTYQMNYYTHSRSASGNFNYGHTTLNSGHSRSASGGGLGNAGLNLDLLVTNKNWTHSRTPSNCSNNSYMSRLSEPISEINYDVNSAQAAVLFYSEQVRQEMRENDTSNQTTCEEMNKNDDEKDSEKISTSLSNLHLGCINEIDAGNEADVEER